MMISGEVIGLVGINFIFFVTVIAYIVTYLRMPKHTLKGLIGIFLIVAITSLYVIITVFFRSSTWFTQHLLFLPPVAITVPIYYMTIKQDEKRNKTFFWSTIIALMLICYVVF